jgi:hypothetical protein
MGVGAGAGGGYGHTDELRMMNCHEAMASPDRHLNAAHIFKGVNSCNVSVVSGLE